MIKLVIFDMDGVLVDSEKVTAKASKDALAKWGVNASLTDFIEYAGMGDDKFVGCVAEKYGVKYDVEMKEEMYRIYCERSKTDVFVYDWSKPIIETLGKKYTLALASAADLPKVKANIDCIGVDTSVFKALITGSDVEKKKPDPTIFLKAAEKAGIAPENAVVFEDAVSGVMAAKAAGMTAIAVTTTFDEETLKNAGADFVVDNLSDSVKIIEELNK